MAEVIMWVRAVLAIVFGALVVVLAPSVRTSNDPTAVLPEATQSAQVAALLRQLPSGQANPALVVFSHGGQPLTDAELDRARSLGTPVVSPNRDAALVAVPLPAALPAEELIAAVKQLRTRAAAGLPPGATAQVTGGAGFSADVADSFTGANTNLLVVTVIVVALLLLLTYRSPILWLVPLTVVGLADRVSSGLIALVSRHTDLAVSDATVGIVTVLVFGAGTDYALLLISRYREELRRHADRREAMRVATRGAGPAIVASAGTVVLSLLTLLLARLGDTAALGATAALGIGVAALFALLVLPAALVVCGRGLFWPFVPRAGDVAREQERGVWARVGRGVARRPGLVAVASVLILGVLATGLAGTRLGLSQTEQFRVPAESVDGFETLSRYFPAGAADPATVLASPAAADRVLAAVTATPGVAQARVAERSADLVSIDAILTAAPDTAESYATISRMRDAVAADGGLVGGAVATNLDVRDAAERDLRVIVPVILLVVLVVLGLLLRAVTAAVLLIVTVIGSFAAALGAGAWLFRNFTDFPALDNQVPLFAFLFLVALGVDYNIFLVTRAREETVEHGTRTGMIRALAATGAVITSAGVLLAAVFAVLGVLPVITLTQIGVIVGLGVLLDTLLVRTVLVPALAALLGESFWWPARPARPPARALLDGEEAHAVAGEVGR
jgi:RND superfamily putative drug exporter